MRICRHKSCRCSGCKFDVGTATGRDTNGANLRSQPVIVDGVWVSKSGNKEKKCVDGSQSRDKKARWPVRARHAEIGKVVGLNGESVRREGAHWKEQ